MMMARDDVLKLCEYHKVCDEAMDWLRTQPAEATAEQLLADCKRGDWMLWLAPRIGIGEAHTYVRIACEMARSVLHLVPEGEDRPRRAIELAERSLAEPVPQEDLLAARDAAGAAARAAALAAGDAAWAAALAAGDAAWAAARAAGDAAWAAARAAGDAAWAAARAARAAAYAAAWAAAYAAAWAAGDAARASQADIVMRHLPLEMWLDAVKVSAI